MFTSLIALKKGEAHYVLCRPHMNLQLQCASRRTSDLSLGDGSENVEPSVSTYNTPNFVTFTQGAPLRRPARATQQQQQHCLLHCSSKSSWRAHRVSPGMVKRGRRPRSTGSTSSACLPRRCSISRPSKTNIRCSSTSDQSAVADGSSHGVVAAVSTPNRGIGCLSGLASR